MNKPASNIRDAKSTRPDFGINLDSVRRFLTDKEDRRRKNLDERFKQMTADCEKIINHIVTHHSVRRVYQWGSLLDRRRFSEISDIDIALEGVKDYQDFSNILGEAMAMTAFPLDIVELERVGEENARYIRETGRMVYGQD
jgi:predicted nucleotidyltransferase